MNYGQYEALASFYDGLNPDVDYEKWGELLHLAIQKYGRKDTSLVLDLACGTGSISVELAKKGYEVIGVDLSAEMLMKAQQKAYENEQSILFLNQNMTELDLYGTVDAVVCCLDSINYLTDPRELEKTFALVNNFMNDGGLFIFDVNTPHKFKNVYGDRAYILEDEGVLCAWQNDFDKEKGLCTFELSFFVENEDGSYERLDETQTEKVYEYSELISYLEKASFEIIGVYSDLSGEKASDTDDRWHFICRAHNKNVISDF